MHIKQFFIYLILVAVGLLSCNKKQSSIGLNIQPEGDLLAASYVDTFSIFTHTVFEDSLRTDLAGTKLNYLLLGAYQDPIYGRTEASIFTNLMMPGNVVNSGFGKNPKLDSIVLALAFRGKELTDYYGVKSDALKFNVYKLTQSLSVDSSYYSNRQLTYEPTDITNTGQGIIATPNLESNFSSLDNYYSPQVRIRLKDEVGQFFMDDTTRIASTSALQTAFNGLFITTKNTLLSNRKGSLLKINMFNSGSKVTIYYHNGNDNTTKTMDFSFAGSAAKYNYFKHDYLNSEDTLRRQLYVKQDSVLGQKNIFLQGISGVKAKISIPSLSNLSNAGSVAINKAELIFKVNYSPYFTEMDRYNLPVQLMLEGVNEENKPFSLPEVVDLGTYVGTFNAGSFGGAFEPPTWEYRFNIPVTAQYIVSQKRKNFKFYLRVFAHQSNPARVVIGGAQNAIAPPKLKVWYTKLY